MFTCAPERGRGGADMHPPRAPSRALAMVGLFEETGRRRFALTPASELLRSDRPGVHDMPLWISSPFHFPVYSNACRSSNTWRETPSCRQPSTTR